jgi:hypothetical protein
VAAHGGLAVPHGLADDELHVRRGHAANGGLLVRRVYGERNAERLAPYHRLDLRASRHWLVGRSRVSGFVDLFNAYGRRNERGYDQAVFFDPSGRATYRRDTDGMIPLLPSFGVSWEF